MWPTNSNKNTVLNETKTEEKSQRVTDNKLSLSGRCLIIRYCRWLFFSEWCPTALFLHVSKISPAHKFTNRVNNLSCHEITHTLKVAFFTLCSTLIQRCKSIIHNVQPAQVKLFLVWYLVLHSFRQSLNPSPPTSRSPWPAGGVWHKHSDPWLRLPSASLRLQLAWWWKLERKRSDNQPSTITV